MQPTIIHRDVLNVVGKRGRFNMLTAEDIPQFWVRFLRRADEIPNRSDIRFGICIQLEGDQFFYVAGYEVLEPGPVPADMTHITVPGGTFAVFEHKGPVVNLHLTYDYIYRHWLPASCFVRGEGPEFERFDERFRGPEAEESILEIYVPIKK